MAPIYSRSEAGGVIALEEAFIRKLCTAPMRIVCAQSLLGTLEAFFDSEVCAEPPQTLFYTVAINRRAGEFVKLVSWNRPEHASLSD
jgi:hypothetical protein